MKTARLVNIFVVVFIDMVGFGLILPLLPYYAETFKATPVIIGLLIASFPAASLLGAPWMGHLSDRYGRRPILLISIAGTFIGYLLLGFAQPIGNLLASILATHAVNAYIISILIFSRMLDGLTGGNTPIAQAYISDVTDETHRAQGMGIIGATFGLGFIIGPVIGGILSQWGYNFPAYAAASMAFLNLISVFFFLPESLTFKHRAAKTVKLRPVLLIKSTIGALKQPKIGPLLIVRFFIILAYAIFWSVFSLFAQRRLNLTEQSTGFVLAYIGFFSVLVQGVGIRLLTKRFSDNSIIITSLWMMFLGLIGWALTSNLQMMLLVILPLAGGGWMLNTIISSAITKVVDAEEIGGMLGISAALDNVTRVIAPTMGMFMLGNMGIWVPAAFSAAVILYTIGLTYRQIVPVKVPDEPPCIEPSCA